MEFLKKLFGTSEESEISKYNQNEHNENVQEKKPETQQLISKSQSTSNPYATSWENFFGVNLKESPSESWQEMQSEHNGESLVRNFANFHISNPYFSYAYAKVIGSDATNFFFECPYSWDHAFDIYFLIERDLVHNGNYTNTVAAAKFRGKFDSYYDSFDWEIDGCNISLSRDIYNGDIKLGIWTKFYNKEYLDMPQEEKTPSNNHVVGIEEESTTPMTEKSFNVNLNGSLSTLEFVQNCIRNLIYGSSTCYIARADNDIIHVYEENSFNEVYFFTSKEITNYLDGRLCALGFKNFDCDDVTNIKAEVLVIPVGDTEESEETSDALIHYEMDYLVDPIEIDYRRKTIMDGKMTLNLVGIQFRDNYEELLEKLKVGTSVILKPDPANEYDTNALAFYLFDGTLLGYLPKKDQPFAYIFMAKGQIETTICNIDANWIDTEVIVTKDMIDFKAYDNSNVRFTKIESFKGGNRTNKIIELKDFVSSL